MKLIDLLTDKECWLWCQLRWAKDEDLYLERIGSSPQEKAFMPWQNPSLMLPFNAPGGSWEEYKKAESEKLYECGVPEWFYYEMQQDGLGSIVEDYVLQDYWHDEMPRMERFGLMEGIAPFQPFLLRFPMPHYTKSWTDCGYEYDVDYDGVEVMRIWPWPLERVLKNWDRYYKEFYLPWQTHEPSGLVIPSSRASTP